MGVSPILIARQDGKAPEDEGADHRRAGVALVGVGGPERLREAVQAIDDFARQADDGSLHEREHTTPSTIWYIVKSAGSPR